ncbi:GNAT family N-acetyltransferase [Peribacillus deserti]|uniref:GNAT family N-acetyltransferase n=1 Tax=Peribacillus deserti TaxID=673318 RepID=A0A2N5M1J5_9BACI|nr:GNAT family N-acetyltransferase [Peribacillus deserti]PLT28230.1 GNAT family N-acetyltransferase [Peribacillus deserti]
MKEYEFKLMGELSEKLLNELLIESRKEGFNFVWRLLADYHSGENTFNMNGEALFGVYHQEHLIALGGVNQDPYSYKEGVGRLRRFYVKKEFRRAGIGKSLVHYIINHSKLHFTYLVLNTDTKEADRFYQAIGFQVNSHFPNTTHFLQVRNT